MFTLLVLGVHSMRLRQVMEVAINLQQDQKLTLIERESRWREKENHHLAKRHGDCYGVTMGGKDLLKPEQ